MNPAQLVERAKAGLDRIEQRMLSEPELIEVLRPARALALRELADAELRLWAERRQAAEEQPDRHALWEAWQRLRCVPRSRLSARQREYALRTFGPELYRSLRS